MMKKRRPIFCVLYLLIFFYCTPAYATRKERLIDTWKPLNYDISLIFDRELTRLVNARATVTVQALENVSQIDFDFGNLSVDSVLVGDSPVTFSQAPGKLLVNLSQPLAAKATTNITVNYHGIPADGLILSKDKAGKPSAVGDNWPDRVHHWIPCLDHPSAKATVTFAVTAPVNDIVVANGKLVRTEGAGRPIKTWTYTEAAPIPAYCMVIAVGEFAKIDAPANSITPLSYYVPSPDQNNATPGFSAAEPSLKFFSQTVAPYPYEKLALIVGATRYGGMENSSAIVFSNRLLDSITTPPLSNSFKIRQSLVAVVAHEIAHQWFGDSVTESTWSDLWLSEGFATYFAALTIEKYDGEQAFQNYMADAANSYLAFAKKTRIPLHDTETEDLFALLNANNYQKGAWILHMLRSELGDDAFFRGLRLYYQSHQSGLASSDDLRNALEKASGKNLRQFFARWVYGAGHPSYVLTWSWNKRTRRLRLVLDQTQAEGPFPNPVAVDLVRETKQRIVIKPAGNHTVEEIRINTPPNAIVLDPDNVILDESRVSKMPTSR